MASNMFNRLKGAIDSLDQRFQEEQAKARATQGLPARSNSTRRPEARAQNTRSASQDRRAREGLTKGPDPTDFDADFVIGDDPEPSRTGTPGPAKTQDGGDAAGGDDGESKQAELPRDVQLKLQKLSKIEVRYQELLRSYRIAHARVTSIEPFEAALRENTPLTSINDPGAFIEYLNQINLKGDMVLDELKRVSAERAESEKKLKQAENEARKAWDDVAQLKAKRPEAGSGDEDKTDGDGNAASAETETVETKVTSPAVEPVDSPKLQADLTRSPPLASRIKLPTFFSPKQKAQEPAGTGESAEDLFSYDSELPRLEAELKERNDEVESLKSEVTALRKDIASARDSAEDMSKSLESATKELTSLKDTHQESQSQVTRLMSELEAADTKLRRLEHEQASQSEHSEALETARKDLEALRQTKLKQEMKLKALESIELRLDEATEKLSLQTSRGEKQEATSKKLVSELKEQLDKANAELKSLNSAKGDYEKKLAALQDELKQTGVAKTQILEPADGDEEEADKAPGADGGQAGSSKKNKKKKKKAGKGGPTVTETATNRAPTAGGATEKQAEPTSSNEAAERLEKALTDLKGKDAAIDRLSLRMKDQESLQEEIDSLRDDLVNVGQDHVTAKERIKELEAEKASLNKTIEELRSNLAEAKDSASASAESQQAHKDLTAQFDDLKSKSKSLETDLQIAQQLASSRFKDLSELRDKMQKAQPEIRSLKADNEDLKNVRKELQDKTTTFDKLQTKHDSIQAEISSLKKSVAEKNKEISGLNSKLGTESDGKQKLETESRRLKGDLSSTQSEAKNAAQSLERVSGELSSARQRIRQHEARIRELEGKLSDVERSESSVKEELELKSAQHASAESLMNSMRDQTSEMATQLKEARERCDGLDEEVADAHRLLNERTREGETMRRLLAEVEGRTESRLREMRDRMDTAIEERERIEDEASTTNRRRAREVEEARNKLREVERELRDAQDSREELENAQRDWKRRREELEMATERSKAEGDEAKAAMDRMRDALDESEKQARELEKQKADLRRTFEESKSQMEKLEKRNKALGDEVKAMSSRPRGNMASPGASSPAGSRIMSPAPTRRGSAAPGQAGNSSITQTDYLKNILLQFLEMKEKKHQVQFVPTLATLLQLDSKDQQKWTAAIMAK